MQCQFRLSFRSAVLPRTIAMATPSSGMDASRRKVPMHIFCFGFPRYRTLCMSSLMFLLLPALVLSTPALSFAFASYDLFLIQKKYPSLLEFPALLDFPNFYSSFELTPTLTLLTQSSGSKNNTPPSRSHRLLSLLRLVQTPPTQRFVDTGIRGQTPQ